MINLFGCGLKRFCFHTFSHFFILLHTMYKTESMKKWKVWKSMKTYELRISSKKIHRIISPIHPYRSQNPDSCKSPIHSFRPKTLLHTFSFFFILFHSLHSRNPCCCCAAVILSACRISASSKLMPRSSSSKAPEWRIHFETMDVWWIPRMPLLAYLNRQCNNVLQRI